MSHRATSHAARCKSSGKKNLLRAAVLAVATTATLYGGLAQAAVTCSTSATGVSFGVYDPLTGVSNDSTGTVSVTCSITYPPLVQTVSYTVDLSTGSSGSFLGRTMQSGANVLNYGLYANSARTQVWGDDTGGTVDVNGSMTIGFFFWPSTRTNTHTVYGRAPALQDIAPGSYNDTIIVTVTY